MSWPLVRDSLVSLRVIILTSRTVGQPEGNRTSSTIEQVGPPRSLSIASELHNPSAHPPPLPSIFLAPLAGDEGDAHQKPIHGTANKGGGSIIRCPEER
jgi:hypothetical protein